VKVQVDLWSDDPQAVESVRSTLQQLPPGNSLLIEEDGKFYLIGSDFTVWACERQGYVKKVIRTAPSTGAPEGKE
jgi:hypothetical protein